MMALAERYALQDMFLHNTPLLRALEQFAAAQAARYQRDCAICMSSVPRDVERAADFAAKAEAYGAMIDTLRRFSEEHDQQQ